MFFARSSSVFLDKPETLWYNTQGMKIKTKATKRKGDNMADLRRLTEELTSGCSVSGQEWRLRPVVDQIAAEYFDTVQTDPNGTYIFKKHARREGAVRIMLDAHMDEIGMLVTEVLDGGFLKVTPIGGLDTRILQAADVTVYGKEELYGVIVSTPPHLRSGASTLPEVKDLMIDTGLNTERARELIPVGTPVGYRHRITELKNNKLAGKGFDDKICAVCAIEAVDMLSKTDFDGEITLILSAREEVSRAVVTAAHSVMPDHAIVLDVTCAYVPESTSKDKATVGDGPDITISAVTDVKFTKKLIAFAKEQGLKHSVSVAAMGTGTNANDIPLVSTGISTALVSVQLKNMHTYNEVISLDDVKDTATLLARFIEQLGKEKRA